MVVIGACHCQHHIKQPLDNAFSISVGSGKKSIISVDIFACHSTVKDISLLDKTVEPIYCVQVIKTGIFPAVVVTVFYGAVRNPRKCMITPQAIAKGTMRIVTGSVPSSILAHVDGCMI